MKGFAAFLVFLAVVAAWSALFAVAMGVWAP